ncbi:MAG: hypothetical protein HY906_26550, partial [Deltaproteobacteria bacterium]|nr:hypothetical protein [Deltaproteobacteria bacterium]
PPAPATPPVVGPDGVPIYYGPGPTPGYGYGYAPVPNPYGISPGELYARGGSLRNIGMPLTIAAIALMAVSIGLMAYGLQRTGVCWDGGSSHSCDTGTTYIGWGVAGFVGSMVGLGVGIPLWAVGSYRQSRAIKMGFQPTFAQPYVAPTHNGAIAGMRLLTF